MSEKRPLESSTECNEHDHNHSHSAIGHHDHGHSHEVINKHYHFFLFLKHVVSIIQDLETLVTEPHPSVVDMIIDRFFHIHSL